MKTILIANLQKGLQTAISLLAKKVFDNIIFSEDNSTIVRNIINNNVDVLVIELSSKNLREKNEMFDILREIKKREINTQVITISTISEIGLANESLSLGAFDFFIRPWNNEKFLASMINACKLKEVIQRLNILEALNEENSYSANFLWGTTKKMKHIHSQILKGLGEKKNIHIMGNNGSGKGSLAKEIHNIAYKGKGLFVELNCNLLSHGEIEEELLSLKNKNIKRKCGRLRYTESGTLYLSNIEKLKYSNQLLLIDILNNLTTNGLQNSNLSKGILNIISSSCTHLDEKCDADKFEIQLFEFLSGVKIDMPSLNEREEDIFPFAELFLKYFSLKNIKKIEGFSEEAKQVLHTYKWVGNITELKATIERAVILCDGNFIESNYILPNETTNSNVNSNIDPKCTLEKMEKKMIKAAIKRCNGNISLAAKQLGVTRQTLYNKGKVYKLF